MTAAVITDLAAKLTNVLGECSSGFPLKDAVFLLGAIFGLNLGVKAVKKTLEGFYVFVLPMFWPEGDWKKKYGQWAGAYVRSIQEAKIRDGTFYTDGFFEYFLPKFVLN